MEAVGRSIFFEKKKQKTFFKRGTGALRRQTGASQFLIDKSFLLLFFKKDASLNFDCFLRQIDSLAKFHSRSNARRGDDAIATLALGFV